jgi:putative transcriptional regulator
MGKHYRSPLMASIHETAEGLHAAGVMDKHTMREFDELCLTPVRATEAERNPRTPSSRGRQPGGFCPLSQRDYRPSVPGGTR